jgi:hypothetical protein
MEFIAGAKPITAYAAAKLLDLPARLQLFATVCDAVHYAHMRGVIHRDLKPENILVDVNGFARIIDFGVVKLTNSDVHTTLATGAGDIVGTLQYMSPEQCEGDPHVIDLRSDIYSLGVILYELVCRRLPYDVSGKRLVDAIQIVRTQEPVPPGRVSAALSGDLDAITLRAMEHDPDRRYQSVHGLALDLRRYLGGEPVHARANSATYTLRKVLWRWRYQTLVVLLVLWVVTNFTTKLAAIIVRPAWSLPGVLGVALLVTLAAGMAVVARTSKSRARRTRAELVDVRRELERLQTLFRAKENECRALRDRLDQTQVRVSEAVTDLIRDAHDLGAAPQVRQSVDRAAQRILKAGER